MELIVAITILALVVVTTVNLFVSMIRSQKRILLEQDLLNQSSYVIEYMGRAIRMAEKDIDGACLGTENIGKNYLLINEDEGEYHGIRFINNSNKGICQEFFWDSSSKRIKESKDSGVTSNFLTADSLEVEHFHFKLYGDDIGDDPEDNIQSRVTIFMDVQSEGAEGNELREKIQTTISRRNIELTYGPPETSCGGYLLNGHCWYAGALGQSCSDVCADHGGTESSTCYEIDTNCEAIKYLIGGECSCGTYCPACYSTSADCYDCSQQDESYSCDDSWEDLRRVCACKN